MWRWKAKIISEREKKKTTTAEKKGQKTVFKNSQRATKTDNK